MKWKFNIYLRTQLAFGFGYRKFEIKKYIGIFIGPIEMLFENKINNKKIELKNTFIKNKNYNYAN